MTTQFTPILQLALPVTGELNGTWGDVVNDNITSMVEQAIAGLATIDTWTANSHTLTTANGTTDEARCAMLVAADGAGGTALTGAGQIICPALTKLYVVQNTSATYAVTLKTAAGTGVAVAAGETAFLFCNGTNVNACVTQIVNGHVTGNLTVDGNATINGNTTLGNATSDTVTVTARVASDLNPSADNSYDLGTAGNSWRNLYIDGTATIATLNVTTIDTTNIEVTNIKAKDGTAAITIADTTGAVTVSSAFSTQGNTTLGNATADTVTITGTVQPGVILEGSSSGDALRITQTGTGNALVVEDSANPDATPFVVDASGNVAIGLTGTSLPLEIYRTSSATVRIDGDTTNATFQARAFNDTADAGPVLNYARARGTKASSTIVQSGDLLAQYRGAGWDGANFIQGANIEVRVDGTPGTNDMPGRLVFSTTADGANSPTERMRIDSAGRVGIGGTPFAGIGSLYALRNITGSTFSYGILSAGTVQSDVTNTGYMFRTTAATQATTFTLSNLQHYGAEQGAIGAGSTVTNQYGYAAGSSLTGATNNYGFYSGIASGTGRYNFYAAGSADNFFQGAVGIGTTPSTKLDVNGDLTVRGGTDAYISLKTPFTSGYIGWGNTFSSLSIWNTLNGPVLIGTNNNERMRIDSAGQVGIGATGSAGATLSVRKNITGGVNGYGVLSFAAIQSDVTTSAAMFASLPSTAATAFTLTSLRHYYANQSTIGAGSTVTTQQGFVVESSLTGATNNYGFYSAIASSTGRWNFYAAGTAPNFFAGSLGLGTTNIQGKLSIVNAGAISWENSSNTFTGGSAGSQIFNYSDNNLYIDNYQGDFLFRRASYTESARITSVGTLGIGGDPGSNATIYAIRNPTGSTTTAGVRAGGSIQSDVTSTYWGFYSRPSTAASAFTLPSLLHFSAYQSTIGAGSTVTNQYGFHVDSSLTGATNNYGFFSNIASGTGRWNFYAAGTADNYFAGSLGIGSTTTSDVPLLVSIVGTSTNINGIRVATTTPSTATSSHKMFQTVPSTAAAAFTLPNLTHYEAFQGTIGVGSAVTTQFGFRVDASLTGATNNYGFSSNIASGTGRYNFYAAGTADNYFAGSVGIGNTPSSAYAFRIAKNITGGTFAGAQVIDCSVQSDVTSNAYGIQVRTTTAAASFTLGDMLHFYANPTAFGAGSTVTRQYGFHAESSLTGATNNFGFFGNIASGTGRYNFYANGTAQNLFNGDVLVFGAGGLGYTTGSGGAVTQATSRTTGVTLNKTNGAITLVSAAGSAAYQSFTVTNSTVAATDTIIINQKSGTDLYEVFITAVAAGSFRVTFATTGGTTTEQPVFNFAVIKAVTA